MPPSARRRNDRQPHTGGLFTSREPGFGARAPRPRPPITRGNQSRRPPSLSALNSMRRAASASRTSRPLRGRPCGPIPDPDALPRRAHKQAEDSKKKIKTKNRGLTSPAPSGMTRGVMLAGKVGDGVVRRSSYESCPDESQLDGHLSCGRARSSQSRNNDASSSGRSCISAWPASSITARVACG